MDFHFFETVGTQKNIFLGIKPCFLDRAVFKLLQIKGSLFLRLKAKRSYVKLSDACDIEYQIFDFFQVEHLD